MRRLVIGVALVAIVTARPELYREKEDFQYSRSSSDDGTKSGYYDAQRGNMGGNFERAHNMDTLAQHQMGGLIKQVDGELGDGSKTRSGSVYTAANSRGMFGSGHYDLSNLEGRNFQEGATYGDSHSHSSANRGYEAHSSSQNSARSSSSQSQSSDYRRYHSSSQQEAQNLHGTGQHEYGAQSEYDSRYNSQSGYQGSNLYEQSHTDQMAAQNVDAHNRLISTVPVKIIIRSGQRVAVPIATQTSASHLASYYDHNAENSDAEVLATDGQQVSLRPSNNAKHYESSYKYHKQWEKHDTYPAVVPLPVPTVSPIPRNSEFYDDSQLQYSHGSDNRYRQQSDFNAASSNSRYQSDLNAQHQHRGSVSDSNSNAFSQSSHNADSNSHSANLVGEADSKPKSYQSSYSYHKSWERQGDPYVIKPASNAGYEGETSQRLTDSTNSQARYDSRYATKSHQNYGSSGCIIECEPAGHIRIGRSYNSEPAQFEQRSQNLEDFGQQSQNQWGDLVNEGQQSQNTWEQTDYNAQQGQNKLEKLEDFGQQSQATWDQEESQQTQNKWDNLENLGQQTEQKWGNLENLGQQSQTTWSLPEAGQITQTNTEDLGQQSQKLDDFGQQSQNSWDHTDNGQQIQNKWENLADLGQQSQSVWGQSEDSQQTQNQWDQFEHTGQKAQDFGQQSQSTWDQAEDGQQTQNQWNVEHPTNQENLKFEETQKNNQETQSIWSNVEKKELGGPNNLETQKHTEDQNFESSHMGGKQETQTFKNENFSFWDKIDGFEHQQTFQNKESTLNDSQKTDNSTKNYSTDTQSKEEQPLGNLWDKISDLDRDFVRQGSLNNMDNDNFYSQSSSQSWYQEHSYQQSLNNVDSFKNNGSDILNLNKGENFQENTSSNNLTRSEGRNEDVQKKSFDLPTATSTEKVKNDNNNFRPIDIGRGDIGPDDSLIDTSKSENLDGTAILNNKETFDKRLINRGNQTQEKNHGDELKNHVINSPEEINNFKEEQSKIFFEKSSFENKNYHDLALANQPAFEQQNVGQQFIVNFDEQNVNQQSHFNFEKHTVDQQSLVDFENQNKDQQSAVNFVQENMDQQSLVDFEKQNLDQQSLVDFDKENQNIDQQSLVDFDKNNMDQQSLVDFDKQNVEQQSVVGFEKQNMNQQFLADLDKHNKDQQYLVDFEKHNFDQQSFVDFEKQNMEQQFLEDLDKNNKDQQFVVDYEKQNMDQQFLADLNKYNKDQQSLIDYEKQIIDQQTLLDFQQQNQAEFQNVYSSTFNNQNSNKNSPLEMITPEEVYINKKTSQDSNKNVDLDDKKGNEQSKTDYNDFSTTQDKTKTLSPKSLDDKEKVTLTTEPATQKPGFWKSVGSKFSSAKNKVASWFSS